MADGATRGGERVACEECSMYLACEASGPRFGVGRTTANITITNGLWHEKAEQRGVSSFRLEKVVESRG